MSVKQNHQSEVKYQIRIKSDVGSLYLVASERFLYAVLWESSELRPELQPVALGKAVVVPKKALAIIQNAERQVNEFLSGERVSFDLPIKYQGTSFQEKVWTQLQKISYGESISYKSLAIKVGSPKAFRAVGTANGRNPLSLVIPCHRVINERGRLGGYAGGLENKKKLLDIESNRMKSKG